jgi:radical SAM protein with 4Fe4S-binding SPASM domain
MLSGLSQINVEISTVCRKKTLCTFCGHQDSAVHPNLKRGSMELILMQRIANELKPLGKNLVVQGHRDGDPIDAENLHDFLAYFEANTRSLVTHGERLAERSSILIENCEAVSVSIFRGDPDRELQLEALREFVRAKGERLPRLHLKVVGDMSDEELGPYYALAVPIMRRLIHLPSGNNRYAHRMPVMPEHGICQDLLSHPSVAWDGRVFICNRLFTSDQGLIGNLKVNSLSQIWNGPIRKLWLHKHIHGERDQVPPCADCKYYGIPSA